jgi:TonB family protein
VLVAALCRAAALYPIKPCPTPPHATLAVPGRVPAPVSACPPAFPAHARESGAVVVEVEIGPTGHVRSARAVGQRTVFTGAAEQAARAWRFVPREPQSRMTPTMAYLVFGFPRPGPPAGPE